MRRALIVAAVLCAAPASPAQAYHVSVPAARAALRPVLRFDLRSQDGTRGDITGCHRRLVYFVECTLNEYGIANPIPSGGPLSYARGDAHLIVQVAGSAHGPVPLLWWGYSCRVPFRYEGNERFVRIFDKAPR